MDHAANTVPEKGCCGLVRAISPSFMSHDGLSALTEKFAADALCQGPQFWPRLDEPLHAFLGCKRHRQKVAPLIESDDVLKQGRINITPLFLVARLTGAHVEEIQPPAASILDLKMKQQGTR